jgi:hypothetical protein
MAAISKESAKFIFEGKVSKTKAANVKAMSDAGRSAVVTIERVVSAPEPLTAYTGQNVTVRLAEGEQVKQGQRATFYTNGLVFGENLGVQSLGHEPVKAKAATAAALTAAGGTVEHSAARMAAHRKIREQVSEAPVVISGKVVAVGLPTSAGAAVAAASGASNPEWISEHDPSWREAVVEVKDVHKGAVGTERVVLRFPSSTDVRWYRAPKFQVGQEGVFSLHRDAVSGQVAPGAMAASLAGPNVKESYTCLDPAGFQPANHEAEAAVAIDAAKK